MAGREADDSYTLRDAGLAELEEVTLALDLKRAGGELVGEPGTDGGQQKEDHPNDRQGDEVGEQVFARLTHTQESWSEDCDHHERLQEEVDMLQGRCDARVLSPSHESGAVKAESMVHGAKEIILQRQADAAGGEENQAQELRHDQAVRDDQHSIALGILTFLVPVRWEWGDHGGQDKSAKYRTADILYLDGVGGE
jgi:hypothetical protein